PEKIRAYHGPLGYASCACGVQRRALDAVVVRERKQVRWQRRGLGHRCHAGQGTKSGVEVRNECRRPILILVRFGREADEERQYAFGPKPGILALETDPALD